jgi:hypothetical protein
MPDGGFLMFEGRTFVVVWMFLWGELAIALAGLEQSLKNEES